MKKVSIIGLGYVGLPLANALKNFYKVCGFDLNKIRINELNLGFDRNMEVSKNELLKKKNLLFTNEIENIRKSDFIIITVPTPITKNNKPDLKPLEQACIMTANYLKKGTIVIFESTVYPSCTENYCVPLLEKYSKKKYNKHFFVGYSPERVNVGDKKHKLENITKIVSGSNIKTLKSVKNLYSKIVKADIFECENIVTAEAAKVIENTQRDLNIAFINEISVIFNKMKIKTHKVLEAAGTKWNFLKFQPGLVGGHCIGVDPYYLTYISEKIGINPKVILSGRSVNDNMHKNISIFFHNEIIKRFSKNIKKKILILGLSFKENTNDLRNSKVFNLCENLNKLGYTVDVLDPLVLNITKKKYFNFLKSLHKKIKYHGILLAVPHKKILDKIDFYSNSIVKNGILLDLKGLLKKEDIKADLINF